MAVSQIIVTPSLGEQEFQVPLEGRVYTLNVRWAGRESRWYLDVFDDDHVPIYTGIAVVLNFPLGFRCASTAWWPGALFATDTSGSNTEPGFDDLGARVQLIYFSSEELPIDVSQVF